MISILESAATVFADVCFGHNYVYLERRLISLNLQSASGRKNRLTESLVHEPPCDNGNKATCTCSLPVPERPNSCKSVHHQTACSTFGSRVDDGIHRRSRHWRRSRTESTSHQVNGSDPSSAPFWSSISF